MAAQQGLSLLNLENKTRQQPKIAHEQGAGSQCTRCGPQCSGFDLHYWRKICRNCRCGKENHLVADEEDPSNRVVRLLETNPINKTTGVTTGAPSNMQQQPKLPTKLKINMNPGAVLTTDGGPSSPLDWVPPSAEPQLAVKYIEQLPPAQQPITGSQAAVDRKRALDRQLPSHDLDPEQCQSLSANEKRKMEEYVNNVKRFVVGQGLIQECPPRGRLPPPPPQLDRILEEKVSHLNLQPGEPARIGRPIPQFITAKPFVKAPAPAPAPAEALTTDKIKPLSTKPHAGLPEPEYFDLPPPPPDMLIDSPPPPLPAQPTPIFDNPIQSANSGTKRPDPVRDFFDFLDEQEGKKLPGKLKSPFLHQAAASGTFNATARPFGASPGTSPNLSHRNSNPSGLAVASPVASRGSSPRLGGRDGAVPGSTNSQQQQQQQQQPSRRLLTTDFDYVPDNVAKSRTSNNNNPSVPTIPNHSYINNNNNNNQSIDMPVAVQQQGTTAPAPPPPPPPPPGQEQEKYVSVPIPCGGQQTNYQQQEVFQEPDQNWSCRKCSQPIQAGTVAIFAERAGSDKCWHPQCFVCSICHEMLADLIYFFVDDNMFCGRHYAEQMKIPRCKACDELIFAPEYTSAEGASWHMDHFCCWLCDTPLAGHQYTPIEGQPHCLDCYQKKYGKDCYECGRPIRAEETRVSHGEMNWHNTASCFKCRQCQTSMMNRQFVLKNGQIYCSRECVVQHAQCQAQPVLV